MPAGPARGMFVTVAGVDGATVGLSANETGGRLLESLRSYGDPLVPISMQNYRPVRFRTRLLVKVGAEFEPDPVLDRAGGDPSGALLVREAGFRTGGHVG